MRGAGHQNDSLAVSQDWLEEPIRDESPEAYATLRTLTPQPFALGEEFASKWQVRPVAQQPKR